MKLSPEEKKARGKRFAATRIAAGLNQSELAERLGVSPQAVQQYENGDTVPRGHRLTLLREILGGSVGEIFFGTLDVVTPADQQALYSSVKRIPVLNWQDAAIGGKEGAADKAIDWHVDTRASGESFALVVIGESMADGAPSITPGALVIIDPQTPVDLSTATQIVLAEIGDGNIVLRRLTRDGNKIYLKASSPGYPIIPLDDSSRIIGVVREIIYRP